MRSRRLSLTAALALGLVFLYVPIFVLIVLLVQREPPRRRLGRLVHEWYAALLHDRALLDAAWLSLRLATAAGRSRRFSERWRASRWAGEAPLAGRRLLGRCSAAHRVAGRRARPVAAASLRRVAAVTGFPAGRGALTIVLAHTTFGLCYAALIVQARLVGLDRALEEAAMDLGARPPECF